MASMQTFDVKITQSLVVMTHSMPGPDPIPAPARPQTDPRCFIADALRIALRHVTPSRCVPPHDVRPIEVCAGFPTCPIDHHIV